jgi:pyruvate/2-oxoglutarate dehydrogenase complex dihydrolipoamide dehydrogenase (E3) component
MTYDVVIIGGGPAGVTAALHARQLGASVALVERSRMGGTCTNDGCVPTRVLAKAARLARDAEQLAEYGFVGDPPRLEFERLIARTQQVVYQIQEKKQLIKQLQESGVTMFFGQGAASFVSPHELVLESGAHLLADKVILCTGGHARRLAFPGAEHALTHNDVWSLKKLPTSLAIIGAAATGCQVASIFAAFGVQVHMLEIAPQVLPQEDESTSRLIYEAFTSRGIQIECGLTGVERITRSAGSLDLHYTHQEQVHTLEVEAVMLSVGWPGNVEELNLEAAGVEAERGYIRVDDCLRTTASHIYAAGDITGRMMLVQSASYEAQVAAENAVLGTTRDFRHQIVPHGGFTDPEYGSVGLTEAQARAAGDCVTATVLYSEMDRAVIDGYPDGFCKLIVSGQDQRILGAHVAGEQALEIVHLVAAGMAAGMPVSTLANLEIAYPTYTAVVGLAARRVMRQLSREQSAVQWRALGVLPMPEWERRDPEF